MIRIQFEFDLDDEQISNIRNHCENDVELYREIRARICAAINGGDFNNDIEYAMDEIKALSIDDAEECEEE